MSAHDPQAEDTRHWSGWTGLAAAIVEQAVSDVRNLIAAGQIVAGKPAAMCDRLTEMRGRSRRRRRCVMIDRTDHIHTLIHFFLDGGADDVLSAAGFDISLEKFKREILTAGRRSS